MDGINQKLAKKNGASWSQDALDKVYSTGTWKELVHDLYGYVKAESAELNYNNVTELNEAEIAVIIQRRFEELNQKRDPLLTKFVSSLTSTIDENLSRYLEISTKHTFAHKSNVQHLQNTVSKEIVQLIDSSPPEYMFSSKLFINQGIPQSLRAAIWVKALGITKEKLDSLSFHKIALTLDVSIARQCFSILERYYPEYSNQSNANIVKTITVNFLRKRDITITDSAQFIEFFEKYVVMLIPLLITFHVHSLFPLFDDITIKPPTTSETRKPDGAEKNSPPLSSATSSSSSSSASSASSGAATDKPVAPDSSLELLIHGQSTSSLSRGLTWVADDVVIKVIDKAWELLLDNKYFGGIQDLRKHSLKMTYERKIAYEVSPLVTKTMSLLELKSPALYQALCDQRAPSQLASGEHYSAALSLRKESFEEFLQSHIMMVPLILVSIIIGNYEDMIDTKNSANAIQSFKNFCIKLPLANLQRLVAENCSQEINEQFASVPLSSAYDLCFENGEIAVKKLYDQFFADT